MGFLDSISDPRDLTDLGQDELTALAAEIRDRLIATVSANSGHLGPNLGVVELTIALHRVFDSPRDPLIFDTGHQAYVHKLLTGRQAAFATLRQPGGMSGYPSRAESPHDHVENSHASTSLSYADGLATAFWLRGQRDRTVVAVIGDGALTGGMAWEALNNIAAKTNRVVIVVNDNGRSYSPTHGAIAMHLAQLRTTQGYENDLGLTYIGPVDGHDEAATEQALTRARGHAGPVLVHVLTRKGAGYAPAENNDEDCLHQVAAGTDPLTGAPAKAAARTWSDVFGDEIARIGGERPDVVAITAAMLHPTGLARFAAAYPDRVFDVGIAEQHAVTSAAGLAMGGLHPVVALYSTFLNRAFDQLLTDVALHRLPVTFVLDRAGVTGPDGASHHGMWDGSIGQLVPGLRIAAPRDAQRLAELLAEALADSAGPTMLRFPKAPADGHIPGYGRLGGMDIVAQPGAAMATDVLLAGAGVMAGVCADAAARLADQGIGALAVDPRWVKPVDPALTSAARDVRLVVTVEDNGIAGGFGDAAARALRQAGVRTPVMTFGLAQEFLTHGTRAGILEQAGLTGQHIARSVTEAILDDNQRLEKECLT
ncbi:MAG TPA: 1-deoxy-D-xylulose-5-phosphate synthase [Streptosporangiaceae bacterium]|nr:1-deoxy-D-xylulose-5-phosphate synthase [Streptosporangiaceae bacterium]